jgi:hypothetical protein
MAKAKIQIERDLKIFMETPIKAELSGQDYDVFLSCAIEKGPQLDPQQWRPILSPDAEHHPH